MRCLLVDDNTAFLEAARILLGREGVTVAGTASTSAEGLRQASTLRPDVVLVDIALGSENGFDLARRLTLRAALVGAEEREHGKDPPVHVIGFRETELNEDAAHMFLDRSPCHP